MICAAVRWGFTEIWVECESNRKSIERLSRARGEDDPINKILNLFKQMQGLSKEIPEALINHAEDKKEEVADFKVQFDIVLTEIEERVAQLGRMLEEHKYDEETKKGCLTIDPSEYLQYISVDKDSMSALLD